MFETISISASAAAIFSADEGCGRWPPKRNDMLADGDCVIATVGVRVLEALRLVRIDANRNGLEVSCSTPDSETLPELRPHSPTHHVGPRFSYNFGCAGETESREMS